MAVNGKSNAAKGHSAAPTISSTFHQRMVDLFNPKPRPRPPPVPEQSPRYVYEDEPFCYWRFITSLEVWCSGLILSVVSWLLMFATGNIPVNGNHGLVKFARRHMKTGPDPLGAVRLPTPRTVSSDLILMCLAGMAINQVLLACARIVLKLQQQLKEKLREEEAVLYNTTDAMEDRLAARLAARNGLKAENKERMAKQLRTTREEITVRRINERNVMTNVVVALVTVLALVYAVLIQSRRPNEVRGFGAVIILLILCAAMAALNLQHGINDLLLLCGFSQNVLIGAMVLLVVVAWRNQD